MTPYVFSHSLAARIIILSFVFVSFVYSAFFVVVVVVVFFWVYLKAPLLWNLP